MSPQRKTRVAVVIVATAALLLLIIAATPFGRTFIQRHRDNLRLASFAREISSADRAVVVAAGGSATLTLTGPQLDKVLRAISTGTSARMPDTVYMASSEATVTFYRGTNALGEVNTGSGLFAFPGSPDYYGNSELLKEAIHTPLRQKIHEAYATGNK